MAEPVAHSGAGRVTDDAPASPVAAASGSAPPGAVSSALISVEAGEQRARVRLESDLLAPRLVARTPRTAHVALVAAGALLLPGDVVRIRIRVGAGCALRIEDVGGTVAYGHRAASGRRAVSRWIVDAEIGAGGSLAWHSLPFVLAAGAEVARETTVAAGPGATVLLRETLVLGRTGERGGRVDSRLRVTVDGAPVLAEALSAAGEAPMPGVLGGSRVFDTVVLAGARPTAAGASGDVEAEADPALDRVMALEQPGAVARWLGAEAHLSPLDDAFERWRRELEADRRGGDASLVEAPAGSSAPAERKDDYVGAR